MRYILNVLAILILISCNYPSTLCDEESSYLIPKRIDKKHIEDLRGWHLFKRTAGYISSAFETDKVIHIIYDISSKKFKYSSNSYYDIYDSVSYRAQIAPKLVERFYRNVHLMLNLGLDEISALGLDLALRIKCGNKTLIYCDPINCNLKKCIPDSKYAVLESNWYIIE